MARLISTATDAWILSSAITIKMEADSRLSYLPLASRRVASLSAHTRFTTHDFVVAKAS
jgi:hypothetical protein